MKIGLCQTAIIYENKSENIKKAKKFIEEAAKEQADIIFFPEMSFTGFSMNVEKTAERDNETTDIIKELALKNNIAVGFGCTFNKNGKGENCYIVVDRAGKVISRYTKIHPFSYSGEDKYFEGGSSVSVFEFDGFRICTFICYDLRFPEIFRHVADSADIVVVASDWPSCRSRQRKTLLEARAVENICYVAGVNCTGSAGGVEYSGDSCIFNPKGELIAGAADEETLVIANIQNDVKEHREAFPALRDRRPDIYKGLK